MPLVYSLDSQTAIVTGGASGIGRATAALLAQADCTVAILDSDQENGSRIADEIGSKSFFVRCNIADLSDVDRAFGEVVKKTGRVDILVNNVGVWKPGGNIS